MFKILSLVLLVLLAQNISSQELSLIHPKNNQVVSDEINLEWNSYHDADEYLVQFSELNDFSNVTTFSSSSTYLNLNASNFSGKSYNWRVIARSNNLDLDTSMSLSFKIFLVRDQDSLNLWLNGDNVIKDTASRVSRWLDLSDSNLIVENPVLNGQPVWEDSIINNLPALFFDSIDDLFFLAMSDMGANFTVSAIYRTDETVYQFMKVLSGLNNWFIGPFQRFYRASGGAFVPGSSPIRVGGFVSQTGHVKNDTLYHYVDGKLLGSLETIRRPGAGWRISTVLNGYIAEIVIINGAIEDSLVDIQNEYLMDKYSPPINLGADKVVCSFPHSMDLNIDYATSFQWSTGDTTKNTIIDSAGIYYLTITDMFERTSIDSILFRLDTNNYQINFGFNDTTICLGDSILITAGPEQYQYQWSNSQDVPTINIKNANNYIVTVTNCFNTISVDSFSLITNEPRFSLGNDTIGCFNEILTIAPDSNFNNVSYLWSTGETTNNIITDSTGSYKLIVTDVFQCHFTDSINIELDSSLIAISLGNDTSLCSGNSIGLINSDTSITNYSWSTGESTPFAVVDSTGLYKLTVNNNFCTNSDSIQIIIQGEAPTPSFLFDNLCFQDTVRFTNFSTALPGDTVVSAYWDFGSGDSDTTFNAKHRFDSVTVYRVILEVTTDKGCSDTISNLIQIAPKPLTNFTEQDKCSKQEVSFFDNSTISGGIIVSYRWDFGDTSVVSDTSINSITDYFYDTMGVYDVSLEVVSSDGCSDTLVKPVVISPSPIVDYDFNGNCFGDSTFFSNQSTIASGQNIDFLWLMNSQQINEENPAVQFLNSGLNPFALIITSDSSCSSSLIDTVLISEKPKADFNFEEVCLGEAFEIGDNSSINNDSIVRYLYQFSGNNILDSSESKDPTFKSASVGSYAIKQTVVSSNQCADSITKLSQVKEVPTADFVVLNNGSGAPYKLEVRNESNDNEENYWSFGNGDSSRQEIPDYIYSTSGSYQLELIVNSLIGCSDTIESTLIVSPYLLDAAIGQLDLIEDLDGRLRVRLGIDNTGNNTIEQLDVTATLNNQFEVLEKVQQTIFKGNKSNYLFNSSFSKNDDSGVNFVCVKIENVNGVSDSNSENNQECKEGFSSQLFLNVYPNPAKDILNLEYVLPNSGSISIDIVDEVGREILNLLDNQFVDDGYYNTFIDVSNFKTGIYIVSFRFNGIQEIKKVVVTN